MNTERAHAQSVLRCACGLELRFTPSKRGALVECACGARYLVRPPVGLLGRLLGALRWHWWALRAPKKRALGAGAAYRSGAPTVACPGCAAVPHASWAWQCSYCYCRWDTFATRGVCPQCAFVYPATECLSCHAMFRHRDWYV